MKDTVILCSTFEVCSKLKSYQNEKVKKGEEEYPR